MLEAESELRLLLPVQSLTPSSLVVRGRRWPYTGRVGSSSAGFRSMTAPPRSVAEVLSRHTTLTLECVDRMYLERLRAAARQVWFQTGAAHLPHTRCDKAVWPSSALIAPGTDRCVNVDQVRTPNASASSSRRSASASGRTSRTQEYLRLWPVCEGVLYIGRAQEIPRVVRTELLLNTRGPARPITKLVESTAPVNHYYVFCRRSPTSGRSS